MLTLILHSIHPLAILLVEKVHQFVVKEIFSTVTSVEHHNPPIRSIGKVPSTSRSSRASRSSSTSILSVIIITIITRVSFGSLAGCLSLA